MVDGGHNGAKMARRTPVFISQSSACLIGRRYDPIVVVELEERAAAAVSWLERRAPTRRRHVSGPRPWVPNAFALLAGIGLGIVVSLTITAESWASLKSPGGWLMAAGRLCGMTGSYLMLIMIVLISRVPWLERVVGQDCLVRWHRRIGGWPIGLIALHIAFITLGYAKVTNIGPLAQFWIFVQHYPDVLASAVGFVLLIVAGVASFRLARRRMKYETWWVVHLYMYLALLLAFSHQIVTGVMFLGHPLARLFWISLWAGAAAVLVFSRVLTPIVRNLRYQLRVHAVQEEAPGVYSLTISGRHLATLNVAGGQFFQWRFLTKDLWWHAHPYSLSALPRPPFLRVTIKALGDQSSSVAKLVPGTRVFVEGPYGAFTRHVRRHDQVVLIGAGVGITPLRALLEDLPRHVRVTAVIRASTIDDLVHREEIRALVSQREGELHEIIGSRRDAPLNADVIRRLIGDVPHSDFFICGPSGFTDLVVSALSRLHVNPDRIHLEEFSF
jgi:predicted ferric reductase